MKTTKQIFDEEFERNWLQEAAYIKAEKELKEKQLMQEIFEEEMSQRATKIVLERPRKAGKFGKHAKVSLIRKVCRKPVRYKH